MAAGSSYSLHVFGNGKGESTVIESPGGWGVVDCFRYQSRVPVLEFLKNKGVDELAFLALSHPHDDHFSGLGELVEYFLSKKAISQFWRYPALEAKHLLPVLRAKAHQLLPPFGSNRRETISQLQRAFQLLLPKIKSGKTEIKLAQLGMMLLDKDSDKIKIEAVAPPGKMVIEAETYLAKCLDALQSGDKVPTWDLNKVSSALKIELGGAEALLCGDVPHTSWRAVFKSSSKPLLEPDLVKVTHHGSKKDNTDKVLDELVGGSPPSVAVVTRYSSKRLPRKIVIEKLKQRFSEVIILGRPTKKIPRKKNKPRPQAKFTAERVSLTVSNQQFQVTERVKC